MGASKKIKHFGLVLIGLLVFVLLANYLKTSNNRTLDPMTVVLTAKVPKDDVFQLFYWEASETTFKIANSVRANVKGAEDFQKITFELPKLEDVFRLRLDIGENDDQQPVTIRQIEFDKGERFVFGTARFNKLFRANKHIEKKATMTFLGKPFKTKDTAFYDPYFITIDESEEMGLIRLNKLTRYPYLISLFVSLVIVLFIRSNFQRIIVSPKAIFVAIFLLLLLLPALQNQFQFTVPLENFEKRKLAAKPNFSFSTKFARDYEAYFDDNFGLRNNLVNWGGKYKTELFRSSIHPELVKFGNKDKWLFYNKMKGRIFRSYSRTSLLSKDQTKWMVDQWEDRKNRYEADGRKYFLAFWPNKHSIYPEHLPITMKMQIRDTLSRVDQLLKEINTRDSSIKLTDSRPILLANKGDLPLYRKFDSHWNPYGAFLAYQNFFEQNPELGMTPKQETDFELTWNDFSFGDLMQMLGVENKGFFVEKAPTLTLKKNKDQIQYMPIEGFPKLTVITKNEHSGNKLRAVVFRDSFTNNLIPYFSLHFYEVYYIWGYHEQYVNQLQPDVIIEGFVEREMGEKIP